MLPSTRLKLYRDFRAIDRRDYYEIVRFYERNEEGLRALDFEQAFECILYYTEALYRIGAYGKHQVMCDYLLEMVIMYNVNNWDGRDVYADLLFAKTTSLLAMRAFDRAQRVAEALVRLYPQYPTAKKLLFRSILYQRPRWMQKVRAWAIALILLSAIVIMIELFVVRPFYFGLYDWVVLGHYILLVGGLGVLLTGEVVHWYRSRKKVWR